MVQYYYNKHLVTTEYVTDLSKLSYKFLETNQLYELPGVYYSVNIDKNTGVVSNGSPGYGLYLHPDTVDSKGVYYLKDISYINKYVITNVDANFIYFSIYQILISDIPKQAVIGSLIQANIIAESGTYPSNGVHTDGYWYVRGDVYTPPPNTAPTTPGAFTQPTGALEIGDSKVFTVGASSDAEANLSKYIWEVSLNNGSYSKVGETQSPNLTYTIPTTTSIKMRVKAIDNGGLESGYRESSVFTVTKPKYYWSKFTVSQKNVYSNPVESGIPYTIQNSVGSIWYPSYIVNPDTGFEMTGTKVSTTVGNTSPLYYYYRFNKDLLVQLVQKGSYNSEKNCWDSYCVNVTLSLNTIDIQGTLIQSGIIAEEGTYPIDGKHTDGFWYVRGSRVNQSIAPPGSFTSPSIGAIILPGQQLTVTGTNSTATNIAQHIIEASYDGGTTFTVLGTPLTNSIAYTVPADKTKKTVIFRSRAKNTSNVYSDYVYSEPFTIQHNQKPTITLTTEDNKTLYGNDILALVGEAKDLDVGNSVTVKYQINDEVSRNIDSYISDATPHAYTKNLVYKDKQIFDGDTPITGVLAEGINHALKVWSTDGDDNSEVQTRYFKVVHNRPPVIVAEGNDLGLLDSPPSITYQVNDPDGDTVTVTEKLDGKVIKTFNPEPNTDYVLTLTPMQWLQVTNGEHELTITAEDSKGMATVRPFTFSRNETRIEMELKNPFVTDIAASRVLVTPDWTIPAGAVVTVEACNNAFDDNPTWEDLTNFVKQNRGFTFTNTTKTATQWGVNIRFTADKGTATSAVIISGFGGAFD